VHCGEKRPGSNLPKFTRLPLDNRWKSGAREGYSPVDALVWVQGGDPAVNE